MSDEFDIAVRDIHRRAFKWFLVEQTMKLLAFIALAAVLYVVFQ
jgi:hypothetical protein